MATMPGIIMYSSEYEGMRDILSQSQKGDLLDALMDFGQMGLLYTGDDQLVKLAFGLLSTTVRREQEKYRITCERNAERARKRWEKNNQQRQSDNPFLEMWKRAEEAGE